MLITETITDGGRTFVHSYSDAGMLIKQNETGVLYEDAIDITPCPFTYVETDEPIDPDRNPDDALYAELGRILMGDE